MNKIPNLTPLRFFLALVVVLFHIPLFFKNQGIPYYNELAIFHKGGEAVYVFFSLSGFLIIKQLYLEKKRTQTINLKLFFYKRILRIFPLYYLVLGFGLCYYQFLLPYIGYPVENDYDLLSGALLAGTFFPNIFSTYSPGGILEILWSIGIEEQFYLGIAPLLLIIPCRRITWVLSIFSLGYFLLFFSDSFSFLRKFNMLYFYFSVGGLGAILLERQGFKRVIFKLRYIIFSLFLIYFCTSFFQNINQTIYQCFSVLLFAFTLCALTITPYKILQNRLFNYLGKLSFGVYMYHAIVMQFAGFLYLEFVSRWNMESTYKICFSYIFILLVTIFIAHISYNYYESYFLRLKPDKTKS